MKAILSIITIFFLSSVFAHENEPLDVTIGTYFWAMNITGDAEIKGQEFSVDASMIDLIKESDSLGVFVSRIDGQKGNVGGYLDIQYGKLGFNDQSTPLPITVDIDFKFLMVEGFGRYRVWETCPSECDSKFTLDLMLGGRYSYYQLDLSFSNDVLLSGNLHFIDPLVGAKGIVTISDRWDMILQGDVGGFHVGCDFTWQAVGGLRYHFCMFNHPAFLITAYRAIGQDYAKGEGSSRTKIDTVMHGLLLGLGIQF